MSKVFGYTNRGTGHHWHKTSEYGDDAIKGIKDQDGGMNISLPTAIPSPFARVDLVKNAFNNITNTPQLKACNVNNNVEAGKIDEKLVSDTLDLAEIIFNIDNLKSQYDIKILEWDKNTELLNLKKSKFIQHRRLAETLELYLRQDEVYNFNLLHRLYLISFNNQIIGCTSPSTLFFPTANDLTRARISITGNDILFDDDYCPLYKRDPEFQKYLYRLFESNSIIKNNLSVFNGYLSKNLEILENENYNLWTEIKNLSSDDYYNKYNELDTGIAGNIIEVIGIPLRKRKQNDINIQVKSSDFVIKSTKFISDLKPLVLTTNSYIHLKYVNDYWDKKIIVPFYNPETVLNNRLLPKLNIKYPYLTVSDFLEPYLIRLVYPINKDKFFEVFGEQINLSKGYVLPLKKQFFDYFNTEDLISPSRNSPQIKMELGLQDSVKVTLKIPVSKNGEYITFERIYKQSNNEPNEIENNGVIVECPFGVTIYPFIKTNNPNIENFYRIQLVDRDVKNVNINYELQFFSNVKNEIKTKSEQIRRKKQGINTGSKYYALNEEFDFIQINIGDIKGIIIPKWNDYQQGYDNFSFAIDFGTTNTHIEYSIENGQPKTFEIKNSDIQIASLLDLNEVSDNINTQEIKRFIDEEFVPITIGEDNIKKYKFPIRTVLSQRQNLNPLENSFTLVDYNIPFAYEKIPLKGNNIFPNLKWSSNIIEGNEKRINAFFEELLMLIRNKVLLNNGDLTRTKLVWFYPSSMDEGKIGVFKNKWQTLFNKYFKSNLEVIEISESLAPFYYFRKSNLIKGGSFKPVVSIDIGGGTTDVVVFKDDKPELMTSFKFAANTIFGDGFNEFGLSDTNSIINKYLPYFKKLIDNNKNSNSKINEVIDELEKEKKSEDINAFLFSIENVLEIESKEYASYNYVLSRDEDLKIIFIYFYTAIIYHIAEIMAKEKMELPRNFTFSGTGSKILKIITDDFNKLGDLSKKIFEHCYHDSYRANEDINIVTEKDCPKEVTCRGGLMVDLNDININQEKIKKIHTCIENKERIKYNELDSTNVCKILDNVRKFNDFFISLNKSNYFEKTFNVNKKSFEIFKNEINNDLDAYLAEALKYNEKHNDNFELDDEITETLFFYPIIGAIKELNKLADLNPINIV